MDFSYTGEQQALRSSIIAFARDRLNDGVVARDRDQAFPRALWQECGTLGLPGLPVPAQYGGPGLDPLDCAIAMEALGFACTDNGLVFSLCAHLNSCVVPLLKFGSDTQKQRFLPGLANGTRIGVHAMTEPASGSDPLGMRTRATRVGSRWSIEGTKTFISNGPEADVIIVFAVTDESKKPHGGVTAFVVERDARGFRAGRKIEKMGLRTSPFSELVFEGVSVSDDDIVGGVGGGLGVFLHSMDWERTVLFAAHVGQMERLLATAVDYARVRQAKGQAIGKFQAVSHPIADMKVRLEAARLLVYRAASRLGRSRSVAMDAAIAKLFVSEALVHTATDAMQTLGGYGYATDFEIERALRDAHGSTIYSGTSAVQRNIIAAWLGL